MTRMTRLSLGLFAAAAVALAAPAADAPKDKEVVLTFEKDNKAKPKLTVGQELVVKVPTVGGTGYTWKLAKNDKALLEPVGEPVTEKPPEGKVGATVTTVWKFKAVKEGETALELHYLRPFEKDAKPAKTFEATVTIDKAK